LLFSAQLIILFTTNIKINPVISPHTTSCGVWTPSHILEKPISKINPIIKLHKSLFFLTRNATPPRTEELIAECPLGKEYPFANGTASADGLILLSKTQGLYTQASILKKCVNSALKLSSDSRYTPALKSMHQYVIAQIIVGSQNSPKTVIDKKNLSITSEQFNLMFCRNSKKSICGSIHAGFDKQSIIIPPTL
jgi:hypothetical protein